MMRTGSEILDSMPLAPKGATARSYTPTAVAFLHDLELRELQLLCRYFQTDVNHVEHFTTHYQLERARRLAHRPVRAQL